MNGSEDLEEEIQSVFLGFPLFLLRSKKVGRYTHTIGWPRREGATSDSTHLGPFPSHRVQSVGTVGLGMRVPNRQ